MAARKFLLALLPFILLCGATLLLLFIVLAGIKDADPLNRIFYFEADTSGIGNAPPISRWTLWNTCGVSNGLNSNCTANRPAYAFQPGVNFGATSGVPPDITSNRTEFFYLSRFAFAFFMIATIFSGFAFLTGLLALCSRWASCLTTLFTIPALISAIIAASLATALYVMARDGFQADGRSAHLGVKLFAFAWTSVACLLLCSIGYLIAFRAGRARTRGAVPLEGEKRRGRFFRRRRAFNADGESGTHVMEPQTTHEQSSF
ncbi:SUR7/PalI family-domain-containing protein [Lipomyces tetrasporus]|uniref:SUR7/PalI family-domain-containing protein n=1 Tax=Lipomyces tetrasporus TaxID=54092 RepID=A0AAD7QU14_9ASCO|nr:SUR7/PalI family-domain-containing protein [Lipomyces tetrasporus]KAJ8101356.1 SUR7/PalI family-domain-containing protein [Lipomyces tetrasporus]